jgi:hypothetical protein
MAAVSVVLEGRASQLAMSARKEIIEATRMTVSMIWTSSDVVRVKARR